VISANVTLFPIPVARQAPGQATPYKTDAPEPGIASTVMVDHAAPSPRTAKGCQGPFELELPTATHAVALLQDTPRSS